MYSIYQVKINDTLDSIANNFGITKDELIAMNNIDMVKYGDLLVVPKVNTNYMSYTIEKGDTLYSIASKYNIGYNEIANINGLNPTDYIYPGEKILVPNMNNKYLVKDGDTLNDLLNKMDINILLKQNPKIYLLPNQLIVYTKE